MGDTIDVNSRIVRHRVIGDYLAIRVADRSLYIFYRPSFIGYSEKSYRGQGAAAIIIGFFMMVFGYLIKIAFSSSDIGGFIGSLMLYFGLFIIIVGIAMLFYKERFFTIETYGGTVVRFRQGGITDRDIVGILNQLSEKHVEESRTVAEGSGGIG